MVWTPSTKRREIHGKETAQYDFGKKEMRTTKETMDALHKGVNESGRSERSGCDRKEQKEKPDPKRRPQYSAISQKKKTYQDITSHFHAD